MDSKKHMRYGGSEKKDSINVDEKINSIQNKIKEFE